MKIAQSSSRLEDCRKLCGDSGYATGYELGQVVAYENFLNYMESMFEENK